MRVNQLRADLKTLARPMMVGAYGFVAVPRRTGELVKQQDLVQKLLKETAFAYKVCGAGSDILMLKDLQDSDKRTGLLKRPVFTDLICKMWFKDEDDEGPLFVQGGIWIPRSYFTDTCLGLDGGE